MTNFWETTDDRQKTDQDRPPAPRPVDHHRSPARTMTPMFTGKYCFPEGFLWGCWKYLSDLSVYVCHPQILPTPQLPQLFCRPGNAKAAAPSSKYSPISPTPCSSANLGKSNKNKTTASNTNSLKMAKHQFGVGLSYDMCWSKTWEVGRSWILR